jgi:hypothetical protein
MAKRNPNSYKNPKPIVDPQEAINSIGEGIGKHPQNNPDFSGFTQEGRTDGKVIDWSKVPMGGFEVGSGQFQQHGAGSVGDQANRKMSVQEGMAGGGIQDPRYYFSGEKFSNELMSGGTIDGKSAPKFAPSDIPEEWFSDPPETVAGSRELAQGLQKPNDPGYIQSQENARARNTERLQDIDRREAAGESNRQDQARFKAEREGGDSAYMQGQVDLRNAVMDPSNGTVGPNPPESMAGVEPDVGPLAGPNVVSGEQQAREGQDAEKQRFNAMMTERARARRGLPAIDQAARDAIADPELAKAYREGSPQNTGMGVLSQQVIQQQGQGGGGVQTAQDVAAGGKYQTGQSVELDALPGGQTSTKVYALGGGIALPDGVGMSPEDFESAYKQLNPEKSMTDAVQGLAREPGPAGAAARNLLRDIGASGGASLSPAQKRQIEQQLAGKAGGLLRGHAQSMDAGITKGSDALKKEAKDAATAEAARKAEEEKSRGIAYDAATKRFESEPGRSLDALYKEEQEKLAERKRVMAGGDAKAKVSASGPDARTIANDQIEQRPTSLPGDSPAGFGFDGQSAIFTPPDNVGPMPVVVIKDADGNPKAAVYLENPDEAKRLPPGTPFVTDDGSATAKMFNIKGTPGRTGGGESGGPSIGAGSTRRDAEKREGNRPAGSTRQWENPGHSETRKKLQEVIDKQYNNTYDEAIKDRDASLEQLNQAKVATPPNPEHVASMEKRYNQKNEALDKIMAAKPEVTTEDIEASLRKSQATFNADAAAEQKFRFSDGDPDVIRTETDTFLPENGTEQRTPSGTVLNIDGQNIPMTRGANGIAIADPKNIDQLIALEANSRGNVLTKGMGDNGTSAATSETFQKTNALRSKLQDSVTANGGEGALALTLPGGKSFEIISDAKNYLQSKYPFFGELTPAEQSKALDGVLLGMGFLPDTDPRAIAASDARNAAKSQYDKDMEEWELKERGLETTSNLVNDRSLDQPGGFMRSTGEVVSEASWLPDNFAWAGGGQGHDRGQEARDKLEAHRRNKPKQP